MMFQRLGILGVLAVCLFAMAIVGCNRPPLALPPPLLTPMEKLAGSYSLVEHEASLAAMSTEDAAALAVVRWSDAPSLSGRLHLLRGGSGWFVTRSFAHEVEVEYGGSWGRIWSANSTTITFTDYDNEVQVENYTLEGEFLTLATFQEDYARIEKWRKD